VQERMAVLSEAAPLLGFIFLPDDAIEYDADALPKEGGADVLNAAYGALEQLDEWRAAEIEALLRSTLVDGAGIKPKLAFGPLRTALSGKRISPPLFESMELLGKESTLARIARLQARL